MNTGVGSHALLQGIFLTQGWNAPLLRWQVGSLPIAPPAALLIFNIPEKDGRAGLQGEENDSRWKYGCTHKRQLGALETVT